jgi:hypothetical protein
MKLQLHDRSALDVLGLHVLDAGDVEEVILVVVGQVAFHLQRVHAAIGLCDVDGRNAQEGKTSRAIFSLACHAPRRIATTMTITVQGWRRAKRGRDMYEGNMANFLWHNNHDETVFISGSDLRR